MLLLSRNGGDVVTVLLLSRNGGDVVTVLLLSRNGGDVVMLLSRNGGDVVMLLSRNGGDVAALGTVVILFCRYILCSLTATQTRPARFPVQPICPPT